MAKSLIHYSRFEPFFLSKGAASITSTIFGPELYEQLFVKLVYNPTINVPKIDAIKTSTMKTQSNIP